jgi:hypothetical protein
VTLTMEDEKLAIRVAYAVLLTWPIVLTTIIALIGRKRLHRRLAFFCLGYLICAGIDFLVGQADAYSGFINTAATISTDKLLNYVITHTAVNTLISLLLAVPPVIWLYRLLVSVPIERQ